MRHFRVRADAETGAWIGEPEEEGTIEWPAWAAREDTDAERYDTYERREETEDHDRAHPYGETCAITIEWVYAEVEVRVYRAGAVWCYALWSGGEYDTSDTLGIDDDASASVALAEAARQHPGATVLRVEDVTAEGLPR